MFCRHYIYIHQVAFEREEKKVFHKKENELTKMTFEIKLHIGISFCFSLSLFNVLWKNYINKFLRMLL